MVNTWDKPIAAKRCDNACPAMGFLYPCGPGFFHEKEGGTAGETFWLSHGKNPPRAPPGPEKTGRPMPGHDLYYWTTLQMAVDM
jgi:hypothetical protein